MYLIDMAGQVVNYWAEFSDAYLLEDGMMFGAKVAIRLRRQTGTVIFSGSIRRHALVTIRTTTS